MNPNPAHAPDVKRLIVAITLATAVMFSWQYFYERPRLAVKRAEQAVVAAEKQKEEEKAHALAVAHEKQVLTATAGPRVTIRSGALHGSLALTGARLDELTLANYRESPHDDAPEVKLLARSGTKDAYFIETGVLSDGGVRVPDATSQWQADRTVLTPETPVTLRWSNGAGLAFEKKISLDDQFMFTVETTVRNTGSAAVTLYPYGLISRNYADTDKHNFIMHEGPLGAFNEVLEDVTYKSLREDGAKKFDAAKGWLGVTDKYWLTAIIPDKSLTFDAEFKHFKRGDSAAYQANLRGEAVEIAPGSSTSVTMRVFAGAKVVNTLDAYRTKFEIPLFDRAVDFGLLYFLTRPIFGLLSMFNGMVGNFGIAILLLTVLIKALLFPLASKSMYSMARMKQLMPKMTEIKERYGNDKMRMNQEIMGLYKREKVNPASGCLPILLQIPVFFALYKVLYVTIEMRHAPFFGWIHDLSAVDPTNIFTLFGIIPWSPPSFMHIGILPLVMCATMVIQQRLSPKPTDEVQAMVMNIMPYMFLFLFASFPAGLVIYWTWNNLLTIAQMLYINKGLKQKGLR